MTKLELKRKILKVLKVFNGREEAIFDICWKEIAEIKKENAELKKEVDFFHTEKGEYKSAFLKEVLKKNKITQQLTKATKLLKWALHSDPEHDNLVDFDTKWKEAEQFIREIEK